MRKSVLNIIRKTRKSQIDTYYLNQFHRGQANYLRICNYLIYRLLVLVVSFLFFFYFTEGEKPLAAFGAGVSVLFIYHFVLKHLNEKRFEQVKNEVNKKIAEEEFWRRIKAMDKEGFVGFVKEILEKLPQFSEVEITEHSESEGIDLIAKYQNQLVAIQCQFLDDDNTVESKSARELSKAMSRRKYIQGIIFSTTDFRDDTKRFCSLIKDKRQIILLNAKEFVQMAIDADKYPGGEEIKDLILKKIEQEARAFRDAREKLFAKPQIIPYFIYGTLLLGCGMLFNLSIKYLYYLGALGLYYLGATGLLINQQNKKRQAYRGWQDLMSVTGKKDQ